MIQGRFVFSDFNPNSKTSREIRSQNDIFRGTTSQSQSGAKNIPNLSMSVLTSLLCLRITIPLGEYYICVPYRDLPISEKKLLRSK